MRCLCGWCWPVVLHSLCDPDSTKAPKRCVQLCWRSLHSWVSWAIGKSKDLGRRGRGWWQNRAPFGLERAPPPTAGRLHPEKSSPERRCNDRSWRSNKPWDLRRRPRSELNVEGLRRRDPLWCEVRVHPVPPGRIAPVNVGCMRACSMASFLFLPC